MACRTKLLTPQPVKPEYFAFLGRIAPEKGVDRAIRIAQQCGVPLKMAAKVDKVDREYFEEQIKPLIDGNKYRVHRRDHRQAQSQRFSAARWRCWCRSIGPSRSAW